MNTGPCWTNAPLPCHSAKKQRTPATTRIHEYLRRSWSTVCCRKVAWGIHRPRWGPRHRQALEGMVSCGNRSWNLSGPWRTSWREAFWGPSRWRKLRRRHQRRCCRMTCSPGSFQKKMASSSSANYAKSSRWREMLCCCFPFWSTDAGIRWSCVEWTGVFFTFFCLGTNWKGGGMRMRIW